ncbi:MAG: DNA gyrase subunit A [Oscillospiraceae bacterium]|nr:DNA gyrase subunit A [Oscillospiraceae bacterium]
MSEEKTNPKIINVDIDKEMKKSFLDYSMSVIVSRALPDVRDGLKPVHRRILYTMFENGLTPDKPYRKCADTVGNVLGRYHPHGDAAAYDALVRLAQDFSMRYILVDGHGNFGSIDGDPPAAYRYTESRMSKISSKMLTDIEKETVNFLPNYDDRLKEPEVLPSRFPNLLVNGSSGIAVGMAANIPPHNLGEIINAINFLLDNPTAELEEIVKYIEGPDFPTGAIIMGKSGIRSAYATGRGKVVVRARAEVTRKEGQREKIIITELPYQVNKARLCENIANLVKEKRVNGIANIEDHSDRDGMHIEITIKRDACANVILNQLYSFTQLQTTFGVIMLAIVNGEPKVLNLKQILEHYINFQIQVITKRTRFDLNKVKARAHILEGLKKALDFIDEVIKILRASKTVSEGKEKLTSRFDLDDIQAQAIVQMRLGQLTNLERKKIDEELKSLVEKIKDLESILSSFDKKTAILKEELEQIKKRFNDKRRTEITVSSGDLDIESLVPNDECVITLTNFGYIKRQGINNYRTQRRGGRGVSSMTTRETDVANEMFVCKNHDHIMLFTSFGRVYRLKSYEVPENSRVSKGTNIVNLIPLSSDEKINSVIKVTGFDNSLNLIMVTEKGRIKRTLLADFESVRKNGKIAITLSKDDNLAWVHLTTGSDKVLVATKKGMVIKFHEDNVRVMGRSAAGVRAIRLKKDDDKVVGMSVISEKNKDVFVLTICENGFGRVSRLSDYRLQLRGGSGIINYHTDKFGDVVGNKIVNLKDDIIIISLNGVLIRIPVGSIRKCKRPSKGVKIMKISKNDKVVAFTQAPQKNEDFKKDKN